VHIEIEIENGSQINNTCKISFENKDNIARNILNIFSYMGMSPIRKISKEQDVWFNKI
jgi:hypothetical protein